MTTEYSGSGDAKRSLDLLWGTHERPTRGPRPKLTVEQIAQAAIAIADVDGLAALSMRRVAERLGVAPMSLYTYVPGKAELIDVLLDRVASEAPLLDQLPGDWRERVQTWARAQLASFHRHPWVLHVATIHPPMGPHEIGWTDSAIRALSNLGLTDQEVVATCGALDGYVRGAARALVDAAQVEQRTGISDEQWYASRAPLLEKLITQERFPSITRYHYSGVFDQPIDSFEFGLQRLLDGIAALIATRTAGDPPGELS